MEWRQTLKGDCMGRVGISGKLFPKMVKVCSFRFRSQLDSYIWFVSLCATTFLFLYLCSSSISSQIKTRVLTLRTRDLLSRSLPNETSWQVPGWSTAPRGRLLCSCCLKVQCSLMWISSLLS